MLFKVTISPGQMNKSPFQTESMQHSVGLFSDMRGRLQKETMLVRYLVNVDRKRDSDRGRNGEFDFLWQQGERLFSVPSRAALVMDFKSYFAIEDLINDHHYHGGRLHPLRMLIQ